MRAYWHFFCLFHEKTETTREQLTRQRRRWIERIQLLNRNRKKMHHLTQKNEWTMYWSDILSMSSSPSNRVYSLAIWLIELYMPFMPCENIATSIIEMKWEKTPNDYSWTILSPKQHTLTHAYIHTLQKYTISCPQTHAVHKTKQWRCDGCFVTMIDRKFDNRAAH